LDWAILEQNGFVGIGIISYSAYLWHQPLYALARLRSINEPSQQIMLLLAFITWQNIEKPFRNKAKFGEQVNILRGTVNSALP
jgi:peptidoglycan/LPS O-acetylase OafA/YrhL